MSSPLSRKWSLDFYKRVQGSIKVRVSINRQRIRAITNGLTMPEITAVQIGSGKRMTAAVLFFDLARFTATTSILPQEHTLYVLNLIIPLVMQIVRHWNGEIEKNTGDGVMAIFGTETRNNATIARDAIECAMGIKYIMLNDVHSHLSALGLPEMDFRMGIDLGELLIARIGIPHNSFLTAVGDAANRAAKLQNLAENNGISVGEYMLHNLHPDLHQYCEEGSDPSWSWRISGSTLPYRYFHFQGNFSEPKRTLITPQANVLPRRW